jgi:hypothetical protein
MSGGERLREGWLDPISAANRPIDLFHLWRPVTT